MRSNSVSCNKSTSCTFLWLGEFSAGLFRINSKSDRELNFIIKPIKAAFVIELRVVWRTRYVRRGCGMPTVVEVDTSLTLTAI